MQTIQHILAVDDSRLILAHLKTELEAIGSFNVFKAHNGQEALDVLSREQQIDLIFLDLKMPVMDGFEFLETFTDSPFRNIPIVVLSSEPDDALEKSTSMGAHSAIRKPIRQPDLLKILKTFEIQPQQQ